MTSTAPPRLARTLALLVPALLLAGAWAFQLWGGLFPCEMCLWQRWPHYAALGVALLALVVRSGGVQRALVLLAAALIALSGLIGAFHAGVEYGWWPGFTTCTAGFRLGGTQDMLGQIMQAPLIRCDVAPWALAGISLAGWNALFSGAGAAAIVAAVVRRRGT